MSSSYQDETDFRYVLRRKDKTYVDVSLSFEPSPVTDDLSILTNERAINNALKNVVMFLPSEVPFDHDVGSNVTRYLFDVVDEATGALLSQEIKRAILFCEPRVTFDPIISDTVNDTYEEMTAMGGRDNSMNYDLGVKVVIRPDQNDFDVVVKYRIIGSDKIFRFQTILTPTR